MIVDEKGFCDITDKSSEESNLTERSDQKFLTGQVMVGSHAPGI